MCSAFSLIVGITKTMLNLLGKCFVREQFMLAFTTRLFNIVAEATFNLFKAPPHVRCDLFTLKNKQTRFSWSGTEGFFLEATQKSNLGVVGDVYRPTCSNEKYAKIVINGNFQSHDSKKCKTCSHVFNIHFYDQKRTIGSVVVMVHIALQRIEIATTEKTISIFGNIFPPITVKHIRTCGK